MSRTISKGFIAITIAIENPMSRCRITTFLRFPGKTENCGVANFEERAYFDVIKEADSAMQ